MNKYKTMDANEAVANIAYKFSEFCGIYPITPASPMAEKVDLISTTNEVNFFNNKVKVVEMQSEAGAAALVHGALNSGILATTFTASQGLLLMIPSLYKIAGEMLPGVFHIAARSLSTHALSIFGDHQDIYAVRQTGVCMLASSNPNQAYHLAAISHLSAIKSSLPFVHFFDGFRTSHEISKIKLLDYSKIEKLIDKKALENFRNRQMSNINPNTRGTAENDDIYFQHTESRNEDYNNVVNIVEEYMDKFNKIENTNYKPFNYYGSKKAKYVIVAMGSVCNTTRELINYLNDSDLGLVEVHLYRPFSKEHLIKVLPKTVTNIAVLDRTKEPGSSGEPLYLDVVNALKGKNIDIIGGRYGLSSKNTTSKDILAIYTNLKTKNKNNFTISINDDVTRLSLPVDNNFKVQTKSKEYLFYGFGSDGMVSTSKDLLKIIGDHTKNNVQGYFQYDSKKSGGVTISHLRFGKDPIRSTYLINKANFVACHCPAYIHKYNMVQDLVPGGTFLLNCSWDMAGLEEHLPGQVKRYIAENDIQFYTIDGIKIGKEIGLGGRINTVLQSAFFALSNIIPADKANELMKAAAKATYGKKGDKIVQMNYDAIDAGAKHVVKIEVPESWKTAGEESLTGAAVTGARQDAVDFVNNIQKKINAQMGNTLPVSAFKDYVDGSTPSGTSAYEKRGVAVDVPVWDVNKCIQCNQCSYVCPHAAIRPVAMTEAEAAAAPEGMQYKDMTGMPGYKFAITISAYDCTGCGSCVNVCPDKIQAITMQNFEANEAEQAYFDYGVSVPDKAEVIAKFKENSVKGSQFKQPLLEFSGACAGCGETPYAKLITQLFGDRMYIANATGCSSIWGNSSPSTPYTVTPEGKGPAWSNSLFEDAAEFGYGMLLANNALRGALKEKVEDVVANGTNEDVKAAGQEWLDTYGCGVTNGPATDKLIKALEACGCDKAQEILAQKDFLGKKSQWVFGGDGWAYDIGFGGVDHVLASGEDINIMVFDTEVYSNTGGQSSKATKTGATAQFAAGGKETKKKDLASMAMSYGYVYVAQIAMGGDFNQTVKAIAEAEAYPGPSLIIAYAPCINHGIKKGMSKAQTEEQLAVECGYWNNFRFNPAAEKGSKFTLDSKQPKEEDYQAFLDGEVRYNALKRANPEKAARLFAKNEAEAMERYDYLSKLTDLYKVEE